MELTTLHWGWPLAGGTLIGLSAALYLLLNGRIAGISGLLAAATGLARVPRPQPGEAISSIGVPVPAHSDGPGTGSSAPSRSTPVRAASQAPVDAPGTDGQVHPRSSQRSARVLPVLFIAGLIAGAWLAQRLVREVDIALTANLGLLLVAGVLVGYGSRLGSGCTSGHGVCGMARLSPRSFVATSVFMATAAITVFVVRHMVGGGA